MVADGGNRWADPEFLRSDQYRSEANLRARQSIYAFQQPRVDLPSVVLDLVSPTGDDRVIDVGCGNGAYLSELVRRGICQSVTGVDLSEGMLRAAQKAAPGTQTLVAEASALPLRDATATLVLAMHMLYHVPQPAVAVEISCDVDEEVMNRRQRRALRSRHGRVPKARRLTFKIATNVEKPYELLWKVRNHGEEAERANDLRGKLERDGGAGQKEEHSRYAGHHYIECYIIKDKVCVARGREPVIIS